MKNEITVQTFNDRDGTLIPIEFNKIHFDVKRAFFVSDVPKGEIRGRHAHYKTQQLLICVRGKILVVLDDGKTKTETTLYQGDTIYIDKMVWDYQQFLTGNDFMAVLCSTNYDHNDYIENINEFYVKVRGEK